MKPLILIQRNCFGFWVTVNMISLEISQEYKKCPRRVAEKFLKYVKGFLTIEVCGSIIIFVLCVIIIKSSL